jgi:ligand-binding sensor domain-containing protein
VKPDRRTDGRSDGWAWGVRLAVLLSVCPTVRPSAQEWRPEERTLLTDFSTVPAVAASPFLLFAATTRGLLVYDRAARRWALPVTFLDDFPRERVRVALADAAGDGVWLGTDRGWARYDRATQRWDGGVVPGGVRDLMLDARDAVSGVFLLSASGWLFLQRGALIAERGRPLPPPEQRVRSLTPDEAFARAPLADAMRALILTDARLRAHQFTSATATPDRSDLFFGTTGMGVVHVDPLTGQWEALPFGLPATGAGGIAVGAGGVWVAARPRPGERSGVTWVRADLSETTVLERAGAVAPPFVEGRRILARGSALWVATERGVARLDPRTRVVRMVSGAALPDDDVRALAAAPDGVWAGTRRGLVLLPDSGAPQRIGDVVDAVLALHAVGETLWVGTATGLRWLPPGAAAATAPPGTVPAALRDPIVALARSADTLLAATPDQLAWRGPDGAWTVTRPLADVGTITALAGDAGGAWVGGTAGLAFWDVGRGAMRGLRVPVDVPAPVRDLAVDPPWLWVATDSGLVRFDLGAARMR